MTNFRKFMNVSAIAVLGATNLLMPLSYADAATGYDALTTGDLKNNPLRFEMPDKDVFLYAITEANKYFVQYSGTTKTSGTMPNKEYTYDTTGDLVKNAYAKTGYTFSGWNRQVNGGGTGYADGETGVVLNWTAENNGVVPIYAQWTPNTYNISYQLNKGEGTSDPVHTGSHPTTATYDSGFTVSNPSRTGYSFSGWTISNMDTEEHTIGSTHYYVTTLTGIKATSFENLRSTGGTVNFLAIWSKNLQTPYKVKHYLENLTGGYPTEPKDTDNLSGVTDTYVTPAIHTYTGFTADPTDTPTSGNIDPDGDKVFTYHYTRDNYNLTITAGRGIESVKGSGLVTAEKSAGASGSTTISFKYDEPVTLSITPKAGYKEETWSGYLGTASSFNMPAFNTGKIAYATPIDYTITIDPVGGKFTGTNKTSYTVEDEVEIIDPWRLHSYFEGWIGSGNGTGIIIPRGSMGDRSYTATWSCYSGYHNSLISGGSCQPDTDTDYQVRHVLQTLTGAYDIIYDITTQQGTTDTPTQATPLNITGFKYHEIGEDNINGDTGSHMTQVDITYNRLSYSGSIIKDTGIATATADGLYSEDEPSYKYEDTVRLTATLQSGYLFDGWTVTDTGGKAISVSGSTQIIGATFEMPASAVTIRADAHPDTYTITIELNSGYYDTGVTNPGTYTVEDDFTLNEPKRDHSVFLGWSGTDITPDYDKPIRINDMIGNRTYEAIWGCDTGYHKDGISSCEANEYNAHVNYNDGTGHGAAETVSFKYDQVTTINNPEQSGYDFAGWYITGMSGGVEHFIGTIPVTGSTYSGAMATGFMNLSTDEGMTDITFTAMWTPRNDTKYVVNHYIKEIDRDTYELSGSVEYTGVTDTPVYFSDVDKEFFGFTYSGGYVNDGDETRPAGAGVTTGNIDKYGNTVINLYYDRNRWTVSLSGDKNTYNLSGAGLYEYGKEVEVSTEVKTGYHFVRWKKMKDDTREEEL